MNKPRRHFADQEKVAILRRHLIDKVAVSDLCDELHIYPNQFYDWLKRFFENGYLAFAATLSYQNPSNVVTFAQAAAQGEADGEAIVANTFTFGLITPLDQHVQQIVAENGGLYQAAQISSVVSREALITAATLVHPALQPRQAG